jgi:hypothetical protein
MKINLPSSLQPDGFSVQRAFELGVGVERLRSDDLEAPFWGVRTIGHVATNTIGAARAYFSRANDLAILSHVSAAQIWGIPVPPWMNDGRLHVSVPPDIRAPKGRRVVGHHVSLHPMDVVELSGLRLTTQARTVCDLAGILREADLLAAVDFLHWWRRDEFERVSMDELANVIARHPTKRGMRRMRAVLPLSSDHADSAPESIIRYNIIKSGLPTPDVNVELFDERGRFLAMPDLSWSKYRVAIDYEGDHHRTDERQWDKDIHRVPRLQDAGWHHTRLAKSDLASSDDFLGRLSRNLQSRGWKHL